MCRLQAHLKHLWAKLPAMLEKIRMSAAAMPGRTLTAHCWYACIVRQLRALGAPCMANMLAVWDAHRDGKNVASDTAVQHGITSMCFVYVVAWAIRSCAWAVVQQQDADALSQQILSVMADHGVPELPSGRPVWDLYMDATAGARWVTWEQRHHLGKNEQLASSAVTARIGEEHPSFHFSSPDLLCYHKLLSLAVQANASVLLCAPHSASIQTLRYAIESNQPRPISPDPLQHVHVTLCSSTTPSMFQVRRLSV